MQIRLSVLGPPGGRTPQSGQGAPPRACDVLVTAPTGTALAAVASGLAAAAGIPDGPAVVYAGTDRLDAATATLGEPPLVDGAVLSLQGPAEAAPSLAGSTARLHVVAGPDAGGVHLLHGGRISIGRAADADVPLDDPDVSRLHCAVTVGEDGRVSVADLDSTNGTSVDGRPVTDRPVRLSPGALLRIGESTLRLGAARDEAPLAAFADGEGQLRVGPEPEPPTARGAHGGQPPLGATVRGYGAAASLAARTDVPNLSGLPDSARSYGAGEDTTYARGDTTYARGFSAEGSLDRADGFNSGDDAGGSAGGPARGSAGGPADGSARASAGAQVPAESYATAPGAPGSEGDDAYERGRAGTPPRGTTVPRQVRRRGGIGAWARRITGGRTEREEAGGVPEAALAPVDPAVPEAWPDPSALLLTALGPGPRLWERGPSHPEALAVRLGTADRTAPDGGLLPAVPVTVGLREAGALGLAGPGPRLAGLARAALAQLAALHSPTDLEIVLVSTDRGRSVEERTAQWSWLGWLPHLRPGHGQDCRLLLAYDREQAAARTGELLRRLDEHLQETSRSESSRPESSRPEASRPESSRPESSRPEAAPPEESIAPATAAPATATSAAPTTAAPTAPAAPAAPVGQAAAPAADGGPSSIPGPASAAGQPASQRTGFSGPLTVLVVDGDPGSAGLREATVRLTAEGPAAGIHVLCLAEAPAASPASPMTATYEAACAASPAFRACGAVALLSGDVATALRLLRTSQGRPVGHGTVASVDAVSAAWAERFARALAPLRPADAGGERHARVAAPLPQAARLLDELGLARATPASLLARWAAATDDPEALGGRAQAVLGAGPRGPLSADLAAHGPHLLAEGPAGSGRTELLRSMAAALASAERPERLRLVLVDGAGGERGDGLRVCTDLPHVTAHLAANEPVRMREFAQALTAELKRRAELLGRIDFTEWHAKQVVAQRLVPQRSRSASRSASGSARVVPGGAGDLSGAGDLDSPPSTTLKLRPPQGRSASGAGRAAGGAGRGAGQPSAVAQPQPESPLPRLVVVVDDLDALVAPALGAPGRPSAGSVVRALEAVAREGDRLGVHLVAASGRPERTAQTELARRATLRIALDAPSAAPEDPAPGRGWLHTADGTETPFQAGRVTGRIPRTSTLRPTAVPLEWHRMGDPPERRPVRELGNGPTDLALLASALERAASSSTSAPAG
ncbi:FHA domain-containing protein [Streptomyces sp. B-S-A8]|uniref:FHA domain-containing protein n=1 Tax=Streptomyces solicavernae TaxID=3043614 RepID=A0ABT6RY90_9ACTN|nr:FHA domain-containing protein [Streptomyces sp. B-S-A8]MDI3389406.1 FHA domain-containing protein [Streptomyces sp. B-S-A8]